jgi:hypothetical protein
MVYILAIDSNKEHIMNQINIYKPYKKIIIQYSINQNKLDKQLSINEAYYNIFLNSLRNNYKNIIIFEDDFTFDYNINQLVVDDIGKFIKTNNYHIYHLGSLFHISTPSLSMHLKSYLDKNIINELENKNNNNINYIFTFNISNIYFGNSSLIPLVKCNRCEHNE